nr:phosphatidylserine/phosphatidylglycerophosphate/cardiolipin synthase family protein [Clostridia bacterium]
MPLYESVSLLSGGKNAFPEIIRCIDGARESIVINMFIWRADNIGCRIADALIRAADRGVKVGISVDRYGMVLEKCEECTHSFFHESPTLTESIKIASLKVLYP